MLIIDGEGTVHDGISMPQDFYFSNVVQLDDPYVLASTSESELPIRSMLIDMKNCCIVAGQTYTTINQPVFGPDKLAVVMQGEYKSWHSNSAYKWKVITYGENGFEQVLYTAPDLSAEPIVLEYPSASEQPVQREVGNK